MPKKRKARYWALHEAGLRNGSFIRETQFHGKTIVAQFINGDFMGALEVRPEKYADQPLVEFDQARAEKMVPEVCR